MRCFCRVNENVRVIDEEHVGAQPRDGQLPLLLMLKADRDIGATLENIAEFCLLLVEERLANGQLLRLTRLHVDQLNPLLHLTQRLINGTLALHGLVRNDVEQVTDAAIRIRRIVPAINAARSMT